MPENTVYLSSVLESVDGECAKGIAPFVSQGGTCAWDLVKKVELSDQLPASVYVAYGVIAIGDVGKWPVRHNVMNNNK